MIADNQQLAEILSRLAMCAARLRSIYYCRVHVGYPSFERPRGCALAILAPLAILIAFMPTT